MQTLDLECPSCGESLELDAGFAGGVCRCSNCGTLMTVPRDAGRAERLSAPPSAGEMSDGTIDPADLQFASTPSSTSRERAASKRDKRGKGKKGKRTAGSTTIDAGEYRTASGKVVHVDAPIRVPMAQSKRKKIRIITTAIFMTVILGIAIAASIGLWIMFQNGKGGGSGAGSTNNAPQYDPSANPFSLKYANVAGLPLTGKVAIVTEASKGDSEYWMADARELIATGLGAGNSTAEVTLYAAAEKSPNVFGSGSPTAVTQISQADLTKWFDGLTFTPKVSRTEAIKRALVDKPDTLILVFAGGTGAEVKQWEELIGQEQSPIVHAVLINSSSPLSIQQWLLSRKGSEILAISAQEIQSWKFAAE